MKIITNNKIKSILPILICLIFLAGTGSALSRYCSSAGFCSGWRCDDPSYYCYQSDCGSTCYQKVICFNSNDLIVCGGWGYPNTYECCSTGSCDAARPWGSLYSTDEVAAYTPAYVCCNGASIWIGTTLKSKSDIKCTSASTFDSSEVMDGISGKINTDTDYGNTGHVLICWDKANGARTCGDNACYNINTQVCNQATGDVKSNNNGPCNDGTDCVSGICCDNVCYAAGWDVDGDLHVSDHCTGGDDCADYSASIYPGSPEYCDGVDNDCDGIIDTDDADFVFTPILCTNQVGVCAGNNKECSGGLWVDCDAPNYESTESTCDGLDNDCNGVVDDGHNLDGDAYSDCMGDCNDSNPQTYPGAVEICDGQDNDCDGIIPGGEDDIDGDGYKICDGDNDDGDITIYPGAPELCDGKDNDQDGTTDEGCTELCDGVDNDADGLIDADDPKLTGFQACIPQLGVCEGYYMICTGGAWQNCNAPGYSSTELCDGLDNNCDGTMPVDEQDIDGDGYLLCADDCNDMNENINPGTFEKCGDGIDNDCDGEIDDPITCNKCDIGFACTNCADWVTVDGKQVRDSGVGYYDQCCCTGNVCRITIHSARN